MRLLSPGNKLVDVPVELLSHGNSSFNVPVEPLSLGGIAYPTIICITISTVPWRTCGLCFCWMNEGHQYVKVQCLFFKCAENMCLVFLLDE